MFILYRVHHISIDLMNPKNEKFIEEGELEVKDIINVVSL